MKYKFKSNSSSGSSEVVGGCLALILVLLLVTIGPYFTISALNLVFSMSIPFTFWTWLSIAWLSIIIRGK